MVISITKIFTNNKKSSVKVKTLLSDKIKWKNIYSVESEKMLTEDKKAAVTLKIVSAIFYQIFIFHQIIVLQRLRKMFFISSKKLSCSRDIQISVFSSSPFFLPVSHCFPGWSKQNL